MINRTIRLYITCAFCLLAAVSCTKTEEEQLPAMGEGEGVLAMSMNIRSEGSAGDAGTEPFTMRIYKYSDNGDGTRDKGLVRKYTSQAEVPQYIWLLEGDYCVNVQVGESVDASFDQKYYVGEEDFQIIPQKIAEIDLECTMQNIPVAVEFDSTVEEKLTGYRALVYVADEPDLQAAESGTVSALEYDSPKTGYFMMPEGHTTICWNFEATNSEQSPVSLEGKIEDIKPMTLYTLKFTYSKDAGGSLAISATVDTSVDHRDDIISFSPDPVVKGDGFDMKESHNYVDGERTYVITALDIISKLSLTDENAVWDLLSDNHPGINVTEVSGKEYRVTLTAEYFNSLSGGSHDLVFNISDANGGNGYAAVTYGVQGAMPASADDCDLWNNAGTFTATVFGSPAEKVEIGYREADGEWAMTEASPIAENTYSAEVSGISAGRTYEYALFIGSVQTGRSKSIKTAEGAQIPGAGFENWMQSGAAWYPFSSFAEAFWGTGNPGATTLGADYNLTISSSDVRPGSSGSSSAYMKSNFPSMVGIGKFAAGNIFVGEFAGTQGTNGLVDFGRPFEFTARPTGLKFWYKSNCGVINKTGNISASGNDMTKIFVCLCNWSAPHRVDTSNSGTFFDPVNAEGVIAYAVLESTESVPDWMEKTLTLTYKDNETKPNYLVVTFTCSGYGDYFTGSTDSWMYVDDVELTY